MRFDTETKVNVIAAYHLLEGGLYLVLAIGAVIVALTARATGASALLARLPGWLLGVGLLAVAGGLGLWAALNLAMGWGLWQIKPWARTAAMVTAVFRIPFVPLGTVAGGAILYVLLQDQTRMLFLAPQSALPEETC